MFLLDGAELLFEDFHCLVESVGALLRFVDDLEQRLDQGRDVLELFLGQFALLIKVLHGFCAILHVHGDEVLVAAHFLFLFCY